MTIKEKLLKYESTKSANDYLKKDGNIPVIITASHTMKQTRDDGTIKLNEPFTKAIAMYVSNELNTFHLIKIKDTGIDSNSLKEDEFKNELIKTIKNNNIKLVIDLHGASKERDFDVEFGTLNHLSADFSTIKELEDAFHENGVLNVSMNQLFKGGGITQTVYGNTSVDVIQLEINGNYRNINDIDKIEKICLALIQFIKQYSNYL